MEAAACKETIKNKSIKQWLKAWMFVCAKRYYIKTIEVDK